METAKPKINVEYLLPFDNKDGICSNETSFRSLIASNSNFELQKDKMKYKGKEYSFKLYVLKNNGDAPCTIFRIVISTIEDIDSFYKMLSVFRKTIGYHLKKNIICIWNGISFEWSKELYPLIYQIENKLRKLINKFLLCNLGLSWVKAALPDSVKSSVKISDFEENNILYYIDFITLLEVLFKPYPLKSADKLSSLNNLLSDDKLPELKQEILNYIPKSNWERYFASHLQVDVESLREDIKSLYQIRCMIAHNRFLDKDDYEKGKQLCVKLDKTIEEAINQTDSIEIKSENKDSVKEVTRKIIEDSGYQFFTEPEFLTHIDVAGRKKLSSDDIIGIDFRNNMGHCDSNRKISVSDLLNRENHIFLKEYGAIDENGLMSLDLYNKNVVKNDILDCFNTSVDSPYLFHEKKKSSDNPKKDPIS